MMASVFRVAASLVVAALVAAAGASAQAAGVKVGDAGPAWSELSGVDDKKHGLEELSKADVVVVVFTCNTCPVAVAYQDRLIALQKEYTEKGAPKPIQFLAWLRVIRPSSRTW